MNLASIKLQPTGALLIPRAAVAAVAAICIAAICIATITAVGCGPSAPLARTPTEALQNYADAIDEGRVEDAYSLLSDDAKSNMSLETFRRLATENPAEMREVAWALRRPGSLPVVTAEIETPDGESVTLRYESGRWRIGVSAIDLYSQASPRQAVKSFVLAYERGRYDVLIRFVPDAKRVGLDAEKLRAAWEGPQKEEMDRLIPAVKTALPTAVFEEVGDRATMPFGAVGTVQLVQEHGLWKIEDVD
ncbi:MAG: hypothetical protein FWD57_09555 [Polyangiaceae bacterium]|nr:hypothetical protein [Polyangiaceae bacterium]